MILNHEQIYSEYQAGDIVIDPFNETQLGPNSYDLRLSQDLLYTSNTIDMKKEHNFREATIPESGYLLRPGFLYMGSTVERFGSEKHTPMIEGRSSIGRCGIFIHCTAGFGDIGFTGHWTLEISVVVPVIIYPLVKIAQGFIHTTGEMDERYKYRQKGGQYHDQVKPRPSGIWKELK